MANEKPVIRMFPNNPAHQEQKPVVEEAKVETVVVEAPVAKPKKKPKE